MFHTISACHCCCALVCVSLEILLGVVHELHAAMHFYLSEPKGSIILLLEVESDPAKIRRLPHPGDIMY